MKPHCRGQTMYTALWLLYSAVVIVLANHIHALLQPWLWHQIQKEKFLQLLCVLPKILLVTVNTHTEPGDKASTQSAALCVLQYETIDSVLSLSTAWPSASINWLIVMCFTLNCHVQCLASSTILAPTGLYAPGSNNKSILGHVKNMDATCIC